MAAGVTVDLTGFSVSFNEYLRLISIRRRMDPDEDTLTEVLRLFDPHNTGQIEEDQFRKILSSKQGITEEDIEEMIAGTTFLRSCAPSRHVPEYKKFDVVAEYKDSTVSSGSVILYKGLDLQSFHSIYFCFAL